MRLFVVLGLVLGLLIAHPGVAAAQPTVSVQPNPISIPIVATGETATVMATISNAGAGTLNISAVGLHGTDSAQFSLGPLPQVPAALNAGQSITLSVSFSPVATGPYSASLVVDSDDPASGVLVVLVSAMAGNPRIAPDTAAIDFGNVGAGYKAMARVFHIANIGVSDLHISAFTLGGDDPGDFTVDTSLLPAMVVFNGGRGPQMVWIVAPNGTITVGTTFTPMAIGARDASLSIANDDANAPLETITLQGTGIDVATTLEFGPGDSVVDFQAVPVGSSAVHDYEVRNNGGQALTISNIATGDPAFTIDTRSTTLALTPGNGTNFSVTFKPDMTGVRNTTLSISVAKIAAALLTGTLSGTGVTSASNQSGAPNSGGCTVGPVGPRNTLPAASLLAGTLALMIIRRRSQTSQRLEN